MAEDLFFLTSSEVAELLRLHHQIVQRKLQAGEIPAYRIGREWRVERSQLLAWLDTRSNQRDRPLTDRWFVNGRLRALPAQRAKRHDVLARVASSLLAPDRDYPERELNAVLRNVFDDVALLRRELVGFGLVTRSEGVYRRALEDRA